MLKPEFFSDPKITQLGPTAALVYVALWCEADDGGVARITPNQLWARHFLDWPTVTREEVGRATVALTEANRIRHYVVGDDWYIEIPTFGKHQRPNNPSHFRHPRVEQGVESPQPPWLSEYYGSPNGGLSISYQLSGISNQVSGVPIAPAARLTNGTPHSASKQPRKARRVSASAADILEPRANWVTRAAEALKPIWRPTCERDWGRLGAALKSAHEEFGEERLLVILTAMGKYEGYPRNLNGSINTDGVRKTGHVTPEWIGQHLGPWVEYTQPMDVMP